MEQQGVAGGGLDSGTAEGPVADQGAAVEQAVGGSCLDDGLPVRVVGVQQEDDGGGLDSAGAGWRGTGPPRRTRVMGRPRTFQDGGGLCSPGRWARDRRLLPSGVDGGFFNEIKRALAEYWADRSGGRDELYTFALRLAAAQIKENPFSQEFTNDCLEIMARHFGLDRADLEVQPRQCFRLRALARLLRVYGDPDWEYPLGL